MDNELLHKFVDLETKRRELDREHKRVKEQCAETEARLLKEFEAAGMESAKVDGMTVYLHRQLWASPGEAGRDAVVVALKETGMDQYVSENYNANSLSAFVREMENTEQALPEQLANVLKVVEKFSLRTRQSG